MIASEKESGNGLAPLLLENNEKLLTCVHCGLCLPACPTYRQLGNENDSPRGRIYLMRKLVDGGMSGGEAFVTHIDLCLGCRACETVCPSGVPYGELLEAARTEVSERRRQRHSFTEFLVRLLLERVFTRPRLLGLGLRILSRVRDSGLARIAFQSLPRGGRLRFSLALLLASGPEGTAAAKQAQEADHARSIAPAVPNGTRVALLKGCVMEGLFGRVNRATERTLQANGFTVVDAQGQVCCGALHSHAGYQKAARSLAARNIHSFEASGCDLIVTNAAGCGAAMKEYGHWFAGDRQLSAKAREFSARVRDVSEVLAATGIKRPEGRFEATVAYDAPCHLIHAQRVNDAPLALLKAAPGVTMVPLAGSDTCCGGAGIYNLQHPELSSEILNQKLASIRASGATVVATGNPGCIMQIRAGLLTEGSSIEVLHPIELLDRCYSESSQPA